MKNDFYGLIQDTIDEAPRRDLKMVLGDFNAQLGRDRHGIEGTVGPFASSEHLRDNGERLISFCDCNDLYVGNTYFQHRRIHKKTWITRMAYPRTKSTTSVTAASGERLFAMHGHSVVLTSGRTITWSEQPSDSS
ncbi:hypothetical protein ANCDUO_01384 [Ancylostoma duodenale]|uniref:Endonuclease/exonuclease/phosphatase domain-containing protein n=1 Tax=Ancylostoma duodenale TaxID=51022 RepID=A0A0C2HFC0_9BILA|nr:hypothetical protein ANCDUO_01384 [Ancylostoma duodenale]